VNLVYQMPNGEVNPAFYQPAGAEWLRTFFAGLLTTCGLTNVGAPCDDEGVELGLHGRFSCIPARNVCDLSRWEGDEYILEISGTIDENLLFGDKLILKRTIRSQLGKRSLTIHDTVENYGSKVSPFTILYHINAGFPLLDSNAGMVASSKKTEAYEADRQEEAANCKRFTEPVPNIPEICFRHTMAGDEEGYAYAALINRKLSGGIGLYLKFRADTLPFMTQWKMMGEKDYVLGMEPCNVSCESRSEMRKKGVIPLLNPYEKREMEVEIGVLEGPEEIKAFIKKADSIGCR